MDYFAIYDKLISRARGRVLDIYTEHHHIIPKCLGGLDVFDNLVDLTPEEHFVAHQLLVKMYPNNHKLVYAANMMCVSGNAKRSNKRYGWLKRKFSESQRASWSRDRRQATSARMIQFNPNAGGKARLEYIRINGKQPDRPNWKISNEAKKRLSDKMLGAKNPNADGSVRRKIMCLLNKEREVIHRFPSLKAAEEFASANHASVFYNRARATMYRGYYWVFEAEM